GKLLAACCFASGCATFVRPEGDGGWGPARRSEELGRIARRAGVDFATATAPDAAHPLDLATALAMAAKGNRRILSSQRQLAIEEERVRDVRGALLPAAVGSGRYTWFTDAQRNSIQLPGALASGGRTSI